LPDIEVSGIAARHSRVTSSTMLRMRKRNRAGEFYVCAPPASGCLAFVSQQDVKAARAEATPLISKLAKTGTQLRVWRPA
jgi:hypothetical protein